MKKPAVSIQSYICAVLLFGFVFSSCGKGQAVQNRTQEKMTPTPKNQKMLPELDSTQSEATQGPSILPKDELIAYFEGQEGKPTYKVPVVITRGDGVFGGTKVFIGVEEGMEEQDRIMLEPDDSGLGIGLADRLDDAFGDQKVCHAWLVGRWGALLEIDIPGMEPAPGLYPFTVEDVMVREGGANKEAEAYIWIQ